jgi:hypothetical protein
MKAFQYPLKFLAVFVAFLMATQASFAYKPEINFWSERQQHVQRVDVGSKGSLARFHLPPSSSNAFRLNQFGSIRTVDTSSQKNPSVLHIQDIHLNDEAQKNIAGAIEQLIGQGNVELIALEGAFGPIDVSLARGYSDRAVVQSVADYLLREKKISGPIFAALTHQTPVPVVGIDDKSHYEANIAAVKESAPLKDALLKRYEKEADALRSQNDRHKRCRQEKAPQQC